MARVEASIIERKERREKIVELILAGVTNKSKIARQLGVSNATITRDIQKIEEQWVRDLNRGLDHARARQVQELAKVREEAWKAWAESRDGKLKIVTAEEGDGELSTTTTTETSAGDPRFLKTIIDALDKEAEIAGTKVIKVSPTSPDGSKTWATAHMEELMGLAEEIGEGVQVIEGEVIDGLVEQVLLEHTPEEQPGEEKEEGRTPEGGDSHREDN